MKKKIFSIVWAIVLGLLFLVGCTAGQQGKTEELITKDMANRQIELPEKIEKVYCTGLDGTLLMYTINDKKLVGLNYELTEDEKKYTSEHFQKLPVIGAMGKGDDANVEEIIASKPDIVIMMGPSTEESISKANKYQEQLNIPVIIVDNNLENIDKSYEFLGKVLGEEKRCTDLAKYCRNTIDEAKKISETIPEKDRARVYYAQGTNGLETDPKGSARTITFDIVGAVNVAEISQGESGKGGKGRTEVSIEQVLQWNPDTIIVCPSKSEGITSSLDVIKNDENWKNINAVKNGNVFETPYKPFNWFDRPPSVNRVLGIKWVGNLLYPDKFKVDIKSEAKNFYEMFYRINLNEEDLNDILKNATRQSK